MLVGVVVAGEFAWKGAVSKGVMEAMVELVGGCGRGCCASV